MYEAQIMGRIVAPFAGAWIEMCAITLSPTSTGSLPSRERGLKSGTEQHLPFTDRVAPFAGAWIEIIYTQENTVLQYCRSLRGSVD